jgi:excisionase family DNA binding protein
MTIHAAALALGYSDMTIRRKIEARQFPAVKMGCKALVPRAFVQQVIADALAGKTVVVEEYAAAWLENGRGAVPADETDEQQPHGQRNREQVAR